MPVSVSSSSATPPIWQKEIQHGFQTPQALFKFLTIPVNQQLQHIDLKQPFPMRVPVSFARCMEKGNPHDPLLKQVLPLQDELHNPPDFLNDPVGDMQALAAPSVLHKYAGRALLITTGACAIHCRYCFRRNFPYTDTQLSHRREDEAIAYFAQHSELQEIILSGGDPLMLSDQRLANLFLKIAQIKHIQRIRIHTRIPVVLPSRINDTLLQLFKASKQAIIMVLHSNHGNELSEAVQKACRQLLDCRVTLLNQAVLLKDVNDDAETLIALNNRLFTLGVLPYYLHMLDKAKGTAHFEVSKTQALAIMEQLHRQLPGYLVPKLVREEPGKAYKQPIF